MTALIFCAMLTLAVLFYVFYLPGTLRLGPEKTRFGYLKERRDAAYENLRDLNFDYKAGKLPEGDYQGMKTSLEDEAAGILGEMESIQQNAAAQRARIKTKR
ncbi:MAG: hypothetical protein ABSE92_16530 [Terriglobales bacterium]